MHLQSTAGHPRDSEDEKLDLAAIIRQKMGRETIQTAILPINSIPLEQDRQFCIQQNGEELGQVTTLFTHDRLRTGQHGDHCDIPEDKLRGDKYWAIR